MIDRYQSIPLTEVFRTVLKRSCVKPQGWNIRKWGSGIVNAKALLEADLPEQSSVSSAMRRESSLDQKIETSRYPTLMQAFENLSPEELERRVVAITGQADASTTVEMEDEVAFHILTNPDLRNAMSSEEPDFVESSDASQSNWMSLKSISSSLDQAIRG